MGKNNNKNGGVVVNIASTHGLDPFELIPIYSGIKHGVVGLTKSFGVGSPCFVPSYIFTKLIGVRGKGLPYPAAYMLHIRSLTKCEGRFGTPQPPHHRIFGLSY
jgi:NAD(P)-dependent dehydrogenase (short-subunit alcohol dehydrogenase family)